MEFIKWRPGNAGQQNYLWFLPNSVHFYKGVNNLLISDKDGEPSYKVSGFGIHYPALCRFPLIMQQLYYRENPFDSAQPDHPEFMKKFGSKKPSEIFIVNTYRNFVRSIRKKHPASHIICELGRMDAVKPGSPWPGYILKAVASIGEPKIYTHFFRFINTPDHPTEKEHQEMAASLVAFIDQHIKW